MLAIKFNFLRHVHMITRKQSSFEPHREKTGFLPMRKQRRRSASQ